MSNATFADAFAPADSRFKAAVMQQTWGHLAPRKHRTYRGHIVFAVGCFGSDDLNPTTLECDLGDLDNSPWFFNALIEFLQSLETEAGGVYRWEGTFRNYGFVGNVRRLQLK